MATRLWAVPPDTTVIEGRDGKGAMPGEMKEGQSKWLCVEISVDLTVDVVVMIIIRDPPIGLLRWAVIAAIVT